MIKTVPGAQDSIQYDFNLLRLFNKSIWKILYSHDHETLSTWVQKLVNRSTDENPIKGY